MKIQAGRVSIQEAVEIGTGGQKSLFAEFYSESCHLAEKE